VLASLNRPNIAAIYGFEDLSVETDGTLAPWCLNLSQGDTLADRTAHGPIPIQEASSIAKLIADALEAAHEKGIRQRDLKPANIRVGPDRHVKLLDFGIAKALRGHEPGVDLSLAPTVTSEGTVVGTPAYMSPEQARGYSVDERADVWAFGCILYEMLTGAGFTGASVTDVLAQVLQGSSDFESLEKTVPRNVVRICRQWLKKDVYATTSKKRFGNRRTQKHRTSLNPFEPGGWLYAQYA